MARLEEAEAACEALMSSDLEHRKRGEEWLETCRSNGLTLYAKLALEVLGTRPLERSIGGPRAYSLRQKALVPFVRCLKCSGGFGSSSPAIPSGTLFFGARYPKESSQLPLQEPLKGANYQLKHSLSACDVSLQELSDLGWL